MKLRDITHGEHVKKGLNISWNRIPHMTIVYFLVKFLRKTPVTPNHITFISMLFILGGSAFFAFTTYPLMIIGAILVYFFYILDVTDGCLSRATNQSSLVGGWYDRVVGQITTMALFVSIPYGIYANTGSLTIWIWAFIAFAAYEIAFIIQEAFKITLPSGMDIIKKERKKRGFLRDLMFNDYFLIHTIVIAAVFNIFELYLKFMAIYGWIFTVLMTIVLTYKHKKFARTEDIHKI